MTSRTLIVVAALMAIGILMMVAMSFTGSSGAGDPAELAAFPELISSTTTRVAPSVPSMPSIRDEEMETDGDSKPVSPAEGPSLDSTSVEAVRLSESSTTSTTSLREGTASSPAAPSHLGQISEEEMAQAFELLGQLLGLPDVGPEELKKKVEEIGGLRFLRSVPIDFMSREELTRYIRELFEDEYPADVAEREERALRALGLLAPGQDLREIRFRVLNENIAGFYDERPGVKKLFAISSGRSLNLMNQLILAHELRHAIQDQHLQLRQALGKMSDYDNRRLAALALIEGDATLVMQTYMSSGQGLEGTGLESLLGGLGAQTMDARSVAEMFAGPALREAPPVVREQLVTPYLDGTRLASRIHEKGGFDLLNRQLRNLPRSMEQVLHPEKYLEDIDEPIDVDLNVRNLGGVEVESEGRVGELFIRTLFESVLSQEKGSEAAAGWGGDFYAVWIDGEGRYHLTWRTVWDTEKDAGEFLDAATQFYGTRGTIERNNREVTITREGFN